MTSIALFFLSPLLKWVTTTYLLGALGVFLYFAWPKWLPGDRFAKFAGVAGVALLCSGTFYWYAFRAGEAHMARRVAAQDAAAIQRVEEGRAEVEACSGGVDWDTATGTCIPGSGGFK